MSRSGDNSFSFQIPSPAKLSLQQVDENTSPVGLIKAHPGSGTRIPRAPGLSPVVTPVNQNLNSKVSGNVQ